MNAPLHVSALPQGASPAPHAAVMAAPAVVPPGANGASLTRQGNEEETYTDLALMAGDAGSNLAVGGILKSGAGALGTAVSGAFSVVGTQIHNQREMETLLNVYRDTVAAQLGIPADAVVEADLRFAAESFRENKMLREELARMDEASVTSPVRSVVNSAAALAGGAVGAIGGLGLMSLPAGIAGSMAASKAADRVMDGIIGKSDALTPFAALQQAEARVTSGEGVSALEMFLFHAVSDPRLAAQIEGHMGDRFEELPEEKQTRTMLRDHPMLTELCKYEAFLLNSKALPAAALMDERVQNAVQQEFEQAFAQTKKPQNLVFTSGAHVSPLAPRSQITIKTPAAQGGYAQAVEQQRAALEAQTQQGLLN